MDWKQRPPVLVGEKVLWSGKSLTAPQNGIVRWIGNISEISSDWLVGIELDEALPTLAGDGFWKGRKLFECSENHGLLVPVGEIEKFCSDYKPINAENDSHFKLDDTQLEDFTFSDLRYKEHKKIQPKIRHSYSESKPFKAFYGNHSVDSTLYSKRKNLKSIRKEDLNDKINISQQEFGKKIQDIKRLPQKIKSVRRNFQEFRKNLQSESSSTDSDADPTINYTLENPQIFHSKTYLNETIKNMNEVAGYFKEIKEGDERFEKQKQTDNIGLYDTNESNHAKPKKLFSFLKWFNKKHKNETNIKHFKESSAASSPMFPRKKTSSCESLDTLFSTQTVRSFAFIPPTQYIPSAPPLDYEKSSYENVFDVPRETKNKSEETESIYDRRKKKKAPEPPRLSRENSLPTTLEHKKPDEYFDGIKTYHRRTVSESFKDKKAGAYCHVQGKRKAPPPPTAPLYPNLEKLNNHYPSLNKKKKPAPPPPESNPENLNKLRTDIQKEKKINQEIDDAKKEISKHMKGSGSEEKETKVSQIPKSIITKDASLSPLPSRPWYKRSYRDSTGSNIIRKDLLKGFDKKKNKEPDDWMPEIGFPRRSLSTESSSSKFNIFSKLEKTEEKKKEEKRKSQISILTNISELDREAAEIVRKEQAEEKKMMAANDEKYYLLNKNNDKINEFTNEKSAIITNNFKSDKKYLTEKEEINSNKPEDESKSQKPKKISPPQVITYRANTTDVKVQKNQDGKNKQSTIIEKKLKNEKSRENSEAQPNENTEENLLCPNVLTDQTNSSSQSPLRKNSSINENPPQSRSNYFNVQNKELNYLNEPWVCQKCTLENPGWRVFCEICSSVKPGFPFNNPLQKIQPLEQETIKPEPVCKTEKPKEENPTVEEQNRTTIIETTANENEMDTAPIETLDELRKRRMNFFTSKLETSPESNKNESRKLSDDSNKMKLTKIVNETGDLLPNYNPDAENKKAENFKKVSKENKIATKSDQELKEKQENLDKSNTLDEKSENNLVLFGNNKSDNSKQCVAQTGQTPAEPQQISEAYVITKTIVLEDIIIKKPERGKKLVLATPARPSNSTSSYIKAVRPPPRTKKITFENTIQAEKDATADIYSGNDFQKVKNYSQKDLEELTFRLTQAEGLADFRANIETMPLNTEMNTVAVNRLLRKLETAINCGDHFVAAGLAKELALMKINCSVTRQVAPSPSTSKINIDLYIEDKVSHQGPIPLEVSPTMSLLQLKKKVQQELGIPVEVQRWILGKKLATDDNKTLEAEGIKTDYSTLFLYLVAPDNRETNKEAFTKAEIKKAHQNPQPALNSYPESESKGWNYDVEEDHCSDCEGSEVELKNSTSRLTYEAKTTDSENDATTKISESNLKKTETKSKISEEDKSPVFDLKSEGTENDTERELKFIPVNSVKQKVEQLNKTFAENTKAVKAPLRSSRSPETWKCNSCNVVNLPGRLNCLSCKAKKMFAGPNNIKAGNQEPLKKANANAGDTDNIHYKALIELQDADLVPNGEPFNCSICMVDYAAGEGVTLKDCLHTFCRTCLVGTVQFSEDAEVKCPYLDETYSCPSVLQQREIKALVPQKIFELHLAKSVKEAENKIENAFHCKTPDCKGWCIYEDNVNEFRCPVCRSTNCLTCQAIHTGINCREYQERMKDASETDVDAKKTRDMLNEMVEKGEALPCPKCQVVLMKKWGCDWLRCSMCKTEICWVTRGFRWGPEGRGDTSGGCKCGINGVKCHPKCNYCH